MFSPGYWLLLAWVACNLSITRKCLFLFTNIWQRISWSAAVIVSYLNHGFSVSGGSEKEKDSRQKSICTRLWTSLRNSTREENWKARFWQLSAHPSGQCLIMNQSGEDDASNICFWSTIFHKSSLSFDIHPLFILFWESGNFHISHFLELLCSLPNKNKSKRQGRRCFCDKCVSLIKVWTFFSLSMIEDECSFWKYNY